MKKLLFILLILSSLSAKSQNALNTFSESNYSQFESKRLEIIFKPAYGFGFFKYNSTYVDLDNPYRPGSIIGLEAGIAYFFTKRIGLQATINSSLGGHFFAGIVDGESITDVHSFSKNSININAVYYQPIGNKRFKGIRIDVGPMIFFTAKETEINAYVDYKQKYRPAVGVKGDIAFLLSFYKRDKFFLFPGLSSEFVKFKNKDNNRTINASNVNFFFGVGIKL